MFKRENLKIILTVAFLIHILAAVNSVGFHHLDEHYQILEFAGLKTGLNQPSDLPWEFGARVRPTVQPAIAYVLIEASEFAGISDPFDQAMVTRFLSAILSLFCMYMLVITFIDEIKTDKLKRWFIFLSFFLWFLTYMQVRFSSEGWSGSFFFIAFALLFLPGKVKHNFTNTSLIGLLFGFAFLFRYQVGIMIFFLALWLLFIKKEKFTTIAGLSGGIAAAILVGILIDKWFYGEWVLTAWNYLDFNIIKGRASQFGTHPWFFYLKEAFREGIPPFSIIMIASFLFFFNYKPKSVFTWILLPFLLVHFLIGHKELRFLFPIANIIPLIFVITVQDLEKDKFRNIGSKFQGKHWKWFVNLFVVINIIYLVNVCFRPADYFVPMYRFIFENYKTQKTVLMYEGKDPYARGPEIANFYMSKNLSTLKISGENDIKNAIKYYGNEKVLYLSDRFLLDNKLKSDDLKYKKVYQNLPEWIESFNYNHWLERTTIFTVYDVSRAKF